MYGDVRLYAANIGCNPANVQDALWMSQHPQANELWEHFRSLRRDQSEASPYFFGSLAFYVRGVRRVVAVIREIRAQSSGTPPTPAAVLMALRGNVAHKTWLHDIASDMGNEWLSLGSRQIAAIRDDSWEFVRVPKMREQLLRGETPRTVSSNVLTNREAHQWLTETGGLLSADRWYANRIGINEALYRRLRGWRQEPVPRLVLDWFARKINTRGMTARLVAALDEVQEQHLINGVNTDPDLVLRQITGTGQFAGIRRETAFPTYPERVAIPGVTQVRSWDRLVEIGREQGHCAGRYTEACAAGRAFMFEIMHQGQFSLMHISPAGYLVQHYARYNTEPSDASIALAEQWIKENGRAA